MRSVSQKMGIKEKSKVFFVNAPTGVIASMNMPQVKNHKTLAGTFDYIHAFVINQNELRDIFPNLKKHLELEGMLWISWPKNKKLKTDLDLHEVIKIGYSFGLVESICLSVDDVWSGLKFTHPKKGKIYNNGHARLQSRTTNR